AYREPFGPSCSRIFRSGWRRRLADARERQQAPGNARPSLDKRDSSGVAPASPQVAYRALLERCIGRPPKKLAAFSALGGGFLRFPIDDRRCNRFRQPRPALRVAASSDARMIAAPCFRTVKRWGPYCGDCLIFLRLEELGHPSARPTAPPAGARRERPRSRRAAECSQQFPSSDGDCHTPPPREVRKKRYHATSVQSSRSGR